MEAIVGGMLSAIPGEADYTCEECGGDGKYSRCNGTGEEDEE